MPNFPRPPLEYVRCALARCRGVVDSDSLLSSIYYRSECQRDIHITRHLLFLVEMSTKHFFNSAEGLVDKAERGAIALNPSLR